VRYSEVFLVEGPDQADEYRKAYPGLLDKVLLVYRQDLMKVEGLRVRRVFVSEEIGPDSETLHILERALIFGKNELTDLRPIRLRLSTRW
jgi:hypothetical protein